MNARRALGILVGWLVRAWIRTLRVSIAFDPALELESARPWVFVFWHGQQLALLGFSKRGKMVVLVSRSRDGEIPASFVPKLGFEVVRGSSSRGGTAGLHGVVRHLRDGLDAAFAVDGPRGPREAVNARSGRFGAKVAAELAGAVIAPIAAASKSMARLWSWDRFELPMPFSRVSIAVGPPLEPARATPEVVASAIHSARAQAVAALTAGARALAAPGCPAS